MAGGVPEAMLHLRKMGLLKLNVLTVSGETLNDVLDWWESQPAPRDARQTLRETGSTPIW
jgi:xylonate dehydratase